MPLDEIEEHPYLDYFIKYHKGIDNVPWEKYTRLFIGSFPVYDITDTIYPVKEFRSRSIKEDENLWKFFYGSEDNKFWYYLLRSFNCKKIDQTTIRKLNIKDLITFCEINRILVTDVIRCTNRWKEDNRFSPEDAALFNRKATQEIKSKFEFNYEIIKIIKSSPNLNSIYFTAHGQFGKNPAGWFFEMFDEKKFVYRCIGSYKHAKKYDSKEFGNRQLDFYFLPTPSSYRSLNFNKTKDPHKGLFKFVEKKNKTFVEKDDSGNYGFQKLDQETRTKLRDEYLKELWQELVKNRNHQYQT